MPWCGLLQVLLELSSTVDELQGEFSQQRAKRPYRSCASCALGNGSGSNLVVRNSAKSKAGVLVTQPGIQEVWSCAVRCVGLVQSRSTSWVSFMIKLLRAYGGCLGARRR